ncbi:MAPEG family protein [Rhodovulum sp. DZ06]|uniref:MAPEG family protein n=1 Tax=Rhodovulum sp. DZ06 TaxID=3425126 RepID=UPI003D32A752
MLASLTPALAAAALYAGLCTLLVMALAIRVVRLRRALGVSLGDGGQDPLNRAVRAHGNAVETIPLTLGLITLAALAGAPAVAIHALGLLLLVGRALHALCFMKDAMPLNLRVAGMACTFAAQGVAALGLIAHGLGAL